MEAPLIVLVTLLTVLGSAETSCPQNCLLDNLVALTKCSWDDVRELKSEGKVCRGCYECSKNLLFPGSKENILPFLLSKTFDPVGKKLIPSILLDKQDGGQDGDQGSLQTKWKHAVFKRQRRAIRDPGQSTGNNVQPDNACKRLIHNIQQNDEETINDVMMNCPILDCVGTFHHDTCVLDTEVCIQISGRTCPDCPKCREVPSKRSRDKKSLKSKLSPSDINSSVKQPVIIYSEG